MGFPFSAGILTADYRDGCVYLGGKKHPAGYFVVQFLNQYYVNDTAARIAVFRDAVCYHILDQLRYGYLNIAEHEKTGRNMAEIMKALPMLPPFDTLDAEAIRDHISALFTETNGERICAYFRSRAEIGSMGQDEIAVGTQDQKIDKKNVAELEALISEVQAALRFSDALADDLIRAQAQFKAFVSRLDEAARFDEKHLLPIALEVFGAAPLPLTVEYTGLKKNRASTDETVARRLCFDRYYSFLLTDFFEGLHYGHYPRRCPICDKYFLMQSARRTVYCSGMSPYVVRKQPLSCRAYGAYIHRKERAENDPITDIYKRRCAAIRSEASRGTITKEFAASAQKLAKEHKQRAQSDHDYAVTQYEKDLERVKLYHDTEQR
ncbi:MAG: hypothetical protein GXY05_14870 [Clostridiales bacterium]|nr:hypothetical protein [Clostridiales bacterium]